MTYSRDTDQRWCQGRVELFNVKLLVIILKIVHHRWDNLRVWRFMSNIPYYVRILSNDKKSFTKGIKDIDEEGCHVTTIHWRRRVSCHNYTSAWPIPRGMTKKCFFLRRPFTWKAHFLRDMYIYQSIWHTAAKKFVLQASAKPCRVFPVFRVYTSRIYGTELCANILLLDV